MTHIRKILGIFALLGLIVIIAFAVIQTGNGNFDGSTKESREAILSSGGVKNWSILHETEVEGYIISAISCEDECEIAIFEPLKDGNFGYVTSTKDTEGEVSSIPVLLNDRRYLLTYANISNPDHAEITFTVDETVCTPIILDATNGHILVTEIPQGKFSYEVFYFDTNGNQYK